MKKVYMLLVIFFKNANTKTFFSYEEFIFKYSINVNMLKYNGIVSAIRKYIQNFDLINVNELIHPLLPTHIALFTEKTKGVKKFYDMLNNKKALQSKGKERWEEQFDFSDEFWKDIYKLPFKITKNSKLQWLQFRISHNILTTNSFLFKVKLVNTPFCNFCHSERETIIHIFWECEETQNFLERLDSFLEALFIPFTFNKQTLLFGNINTNKNPAFKTDNQIILLIKQYIYRTRCLNKSLNIHSLLYSILDHYKVQKFINNKKNQTARTKFSNEWKKWQKLIQILE